MQILINLTAFLAGVGVGYLYGYYVRSRRAIRRLNESNDRTQQEQQLLREQYAELRTMLREVKEQRIRPDLHPKSLKRLR